MNGHRNELDHGVGHFEQTHRYTPIEQTLKLAEETGELAEVVLQERSAQIFDRGTTESEDLEHLREEIGDVVFTVATIARLYNIDPIEAAAETATENRRRTEES